MNDPNNTNETEVPPGQAGHTGAVEASAGGGPVSLPAAQEALAITSEEQLREHLQKAPGKVLLDFVAKDCEACVDEKVILDQLASGCADVTVMKVDVDELPHIADALKADGTPTLYLGTGQDFLTDLERGSKRLEEGKEVGRLTRIKEVEPDEKLMRRLKCARK